LKADVGTEFGSVYSGTVFMIGKGEDLGDWVIVKSKVKGKDVWLRYAHLSAIDVKKGDSVKAKQKLGKTGASGNAANVPHKHLHIEASETGFGTLTDRVDPEKYLKTTYGANPNPPTCPP
jgi:murein DD-endopeptidase MepM/ murein hydrolase activator NlpD